MMSNKIIITDQSIYNPMTHYLLSKEMMVLAEGASLMERLARIRLHLSCAWETVRGRTVTYEVNIVCARPNVQVINTEPSGNITPFPSRN